MSIVRARGPGGLGLEVRVGWSCWCLGVVGTASHS